MDYAIAEEFRIRVGVTKPPFGRQELNSRRRLQFVDRSLANEAFTFNRALGVVFSGTLVERLHYAIGVTNGLDNQDDSPSLEQLDTHFAYAGRLVATILGQRIREESDLAYAQTPQLEFGMSLAAHDDNGDRRNDAWFAVPNGLRRGRGIGGYGAADLTGAELRQFGADAAFRYRGFSLTAEYWLRCVDGEDPRGEWERFTGRDDRLHQQGGYVQAGYFLVPRRIEIAGRVGGVWDAGGDNSWACAAALNYFPFGSRDVVLQTDFTRIEESPVGSTSTGWGQNDEVNMVRVQLQVRF